MKRTKQEQRAELFGPVCVECETRAPRPGDLMCEKCAAEWQRRHSTDDEPAVLPWGAPVQFA